MFGTNILKSSAGTVSGVTMDVYFLNVLQGNCIIVKFPDGNFMLVDAGSTSSACDQTVVQGWVTGIVGANKISTVVITHPDDDHNNLIPGIKQAGYPTNVHISFKEESYSAAIRKWFSAVKIRGAKVSTYVSNYSETDPDPEFNSGSCKVYVLAANVAGDSNTHSIVLSIDYQDVTVLLTGDATFATEVFMLKEWNDAALASHLLSFGHHGSNHSSSESFLDAVKPHTGVFSASAAHMGYGHPRCEIIDQVEASADEDGKGGMEIGYHRIDCWKTAKGLYVCERNDIGVFLTATQGNIKFTTDGTLYEVWVDTDGGACPK